VIALSFALPEESKGIVRLVGSASRAGSSALPVISGTLAGREIVIVHSGMGMDSASARIGTFLDSHTPSLWIAAGFAGGLSPDLRVGDILTVRNFSDPDRFSDIASLPAHTGTLITTKSVVQTAEQKRDLARHTGAVAVDMETAAIHRLCAARGIPMLSIRAISDAVSQDLPVPAAVWFDPARQRPRPLPLLLHLASHPARILPFARFVRGVNSARSSLTTFLLAALAALPEKIAGIDD
jgi:adenosylhomocysteine nucleosidase